MKWTINIEGHKYWSLKIGTLSWTVYDLMSNRKASVDLVSDTVDPAVAVNQAITCGEWIAV